MESGTSDLILPIAARSVTDEEVGAFDRRAGPLIVIVWLAIVAFALKPFLAVPGQSGEATIFVAVLIGGATAIIGGALIWRRRRWRGYRDPGVALEATETGITVHAAGHSHRIAYAEAVFIERIMPLPNRSVLFGIDLQTPIGVLSIDDRTYRNGNKIAVAIAQRAVALGAKARP